MTLTDMAQTPDMAQTGLKEPQQIDWDNYNTGSSYVPPVPALDDNNKPLVYHGKVVTANETDPDRGFLQYLFDPISITGPDGANGKEIRFTWVSARPFMKKDSDGELHPIKGNPNQLANFLRACGGGARPQTNEEYRASVAAALSRSFDFTVDWEARNKDSGEVIRGFLSFPLDTDRPGQRVSILRNGDIYNIVDKQGNIIETATVQSDVLFANARLKYFRDRRSA